VGVATTPTTPGGVATSFTTPAVLETAPTPEPERKQAVAQETAAGEQSRVLYTPDPPTQGNTAERVLASSPAEDILTSESPLPPPATHSPPHHSTPSKGEEIGAEAPPSLQLDHSGPSPVPNHTQSPSVLITNGDATPPVAGNGHGPAQPAQPSIQPTQSLVQNGYSRLQGGSVGVSGGVRVEDGILSSSASEAGSPQVSQSPCIASLPRPTTLLPVSPTNVLTHSPSFALSCYP
jgi:hypothetical protein